MTATQAQQMADKIAELNKAQQTIDQEQGPTNYTSGYLTTGWPPYPQPCPTCGKCPTCGRGGYYPYNYPYMYTC